MIDRLSEGGVVIVVNPRSGRGRGEAFAEAAARAVRSCGREVRVERAGEGPGPSGSDALAVVVGGDGTLHHALGPAARAGTPVYHLATGTENLFAREFAMVRTRSPERAGEALASAVRAGGVRRIDLGTCSTPGGAERAFALMAGIGFDARVIERLDARRGARITHRSYVRPIIEAAWTWRAASLRVACDGRPWIEGERGTLVVANSRQYAGRLDPARGAGVDDGALDAVFFGCRSALGLVPGAIAARARHVAWSPGVRAARARSITVEATGAPLQLDGEACATLRGEASFGVRSGALRVLLPA